MKLDRHLNPDGHGKYALINLRKLRAQASGPKGQFLQLALSVLQENGLLHWGNESPGDQFFVLKYKDKFTPVALDSYALAVRDCADDLAEKDDTKANDLWEYAEEIRAEAAKAEAVAHRLPD